MQNEIKTGETYKHQLGNVTVLRIEDNTVHFQYGQITQSQGYNGFLRSVELPTGLTAEQAKETSLTILEQLGGNKFIVFVGASHMGFDSDGSLSFRFKMNPKVNYMKITLNGLDLYDVTFWKVGKICKQISEHKNIYFDMLQPLFTKETGLLTHF